MILYFSGTGNSRFIAEGLAKICDDDIINLKDLMKNGGTGELHSDKPFVFVLPIHGFRIPGKVNEFIETIKFTGSSSAYFIVDCGGSPGNALKYIKNTCKKIDLQLKGFDAINMPASYIVMYNPPDVNGEVVHDSLVYQKSQIERIGRDINEGKEFFNRPSDFKGKIQSSVLNPIFVKMMIKTKDFTVSDKCVKCGSCVLRCPLNNVFFNGKPEWGDNCMHCMACLSGCPFNAIEYGNKTVGRNRYYLLKHYGDVN